MAHLHNPLLEAEPFEQQAGTQKVVSPEELKAFYDEQKKEVVERKLSRRKSGSGGSKIWNRRSVKRSTATSTYQPTNTSNTSRHSLPPPNGVPEQAGSDEFREMEKLEYRDRSHSSAQISPSRSILPDPLKELPAWYKDESTSIAHHRTRYPMYNPHGPRYYLNHHLIPPHKRAGARPNSTFSPVTTLNGTSSFQERSQDSMRFQASSRTPSNSPLPTPSSSQIRVTDTYPGGKPRSRKNSQTAHDGVDLLDVSDPWGTNWHHGSPYDVGLENEPVTVEAQESAASRRQANGNPKDTRRRTITPSPLSQSTSAVHLETPDVGAHIPRKLSKRRQPGVGNIFGQKEPQRNAVSLPSTPVDQSTTPTTSHPASATLPPSSLSKASSISGSPTKKEKRSSVFGKLAKKFSLLKKHTEVERHEPQNWTENIESSRTSPTKSRPQMPLSDSSFSVTRQPTLPPVEHPVRSEPDKDSRSSMEQPFSMGRLTVANPDPATADNTPIQNDTPLPIDNRAPVASSSYDPEMSTPRLISSSPPRVLSGHDSRPVSTTHRVVNGGPDSRRYSTSDYSSSHPQKQLPSHDQSPGPSSPPTFATTSTPSEPLTMPVAVEEAYPNVGEKATNLPKPQTSSSTLRPEVNDKSSIAFPSPPSPSETPLPEYLAPFISSAPNLADSSPLSAASIIANPPTPYNPNLSVPSTPETIPPSLPPKNTDVKRLPREPSPSTISSTLGRQTETFKLMRSSSGTVYASSETIHVSGQQWEVVEDVRGRTSSRSKDREVKRESKTRHTVEDAESGSRHSGNSRRRQLSLETTTFNKDKPLPRANSTEAARARDEQSDPHHSRKGRKIERKPVPPEPQQPKVDKPQPELPPSDPPNPAPVERKHSISARPTSEVPPTAELNAMLAREAWQMDRLWKAKSLYTPDQNGPETLPAISNADFSPVADNGRGVHGSSHTSYAVSSPFPTKPVATHIYHSMPTVAPPVIYASVPSMPELGQASRHEPRLAHMPYSAPDISPLISNPLPEPPRESSYVPAPIPYDAVNTRTSRSGQYWNGQAGLTTSHLS